MDMALDLRIELREIEPKIWRRVLVSDATKLGTLHRIIQCAMPWHNCHLHEFRSEDESRVFMNPEHADGEIDAEDEAKVTLRSLLKVPGQKLLYIYDFGDSWVHLITFEGKVDMPKGARIPCLVDGARAAPPEDVGGVFGYEELVEASKNRKSTNENGRELLEWYGGPFDAEFFDISRLQQNIYSGYRRIE
jgi:hypothetical protein